MKKTCFRVIPLLAFVSFSILTAHGQIQSENYGITTSEFSGGGTLAESAPGGSYENNATLGQPSPIINPELPQPGSNNYELYPGFQYTLGAGIPECDLLSFATAFGSIFGDEN